MLQHSVLSVSKLNALTIAPKHDRMTCCQEECFLKASLTRRHLSLLLFVFSLRSRAPPQKNKETYFKTKQKQVIHKCVTKFFHAGLLLSAPSHGATQHPHRSQKPTEEETPTGRAPALIHQTWCKNQLSERQPAPHP